MNAKDVIGYRALETAAQQIGEEGSSEPGVPDTIEDRLEAIRRRKEIEHEEGRSISPQLVLNPSRSGSPSPVSSTHSSRSTSPSLSRKSSSGPPPPPSLSPANIPLPATPSTEPRDQYFSLPATPHPNSHFTSPSAPITSSSSSTSDPLKLSNPKDTMGQKRSSRRGPSRLSTSFLAGREEGRDGEGESGGEDESEDGGSSRGSRSGEASPVEQDPISEVEEGEGEEGKEGKEGEGSLSPTIDVPLDQAEPPSDEISPTHPCHDPNHGVEFCDSPEEELFEREDEADDDFSSNHPDYLPSSNAALSSPSTERPPSYHNPDSSRTGYPFRTFAGTPGPAADEPSFFPQNAAPAAVGGEASAVLDDGGEGLPTEARFLPVAADMDLEDESLTTLERIFLLSKSEFTHHRFVSSFSSSRGTQKLGLLIHLLISWSQDVHLESYRRLGGRRRSMRDGRVCAPATEFVGNR
jgi:hypothetical protein